MDVKQTQEAIKVMQAYVDGETIECKGEHEKQWDECFPVWEWTTCDYRIVTQPLRAYPIVKDGMIVKVVSAELDDEALAALPSGYHAVLLQETDS